MSNDTDFTLRFRHKSKRYLEEFRKYAEEKKARWERAKATGKSIKALLEQAGLKKDNELLSWGFAFDKINRAGDMYCMPATAWANQNSANLHITGKDGELADVLAHFPELEVEGEYSDEYGRGSVYQTEQSFEEPLESDVIEVTFDSSFLHSMFYDPEAEELVVSLASGNTYTYSGVPRHVAEEFAEASSPGSYFNSEIKGVYDGGG